MRTLSAKSRVLFAAAAVFAAVLILGGAYFVGYVGEIQRDLSDPSSARARAAQSIATVERSLGYAGFLKAYRNYRLTGDADARLELAKAVNAAGRALDTLRAVYAGDPIAGDALREAGAVLETYTHIARTAPNTGAALRGTAAMDTLATLPQPPQLEAAYVSLRSALDRLGQADLAHQLGGAALALNWTQMLVIGAIVAVVLCLIAVAALLQMGIIQPLKSLEHSLTAVGDGAVSHAVWGTERPDEIGALARASDKVRRGLAETTALKMLADKGALHVTIEGQASVLFEKLAADVASATEALKEASAGLVKLHDDGNRRVEAAVEGVGRAGERFGDAATAARDEATAAIEEIRVSATKMGEAADARTKRLDEIATRFETGAKVMDTAVGAAKDKTAVAVAQLADSTDALKRIAGDAQAIQGAFFTTCDKISSDAANTTEKVRTLAAGLNDAVGAVDTRLTQKLNALDQLEQSLTATLAKLQQRASETVAALNDAAGTFDERTAAAGARTAKTAAEFEDVLRLFRDDAATVQKRTLDGTTQAHAALDEAIARLDGLAAKMTAAPATQPPAIDLAAVTGALQSQSEQIRAEIRELAVRLTEDRLLAGADMPFLNAKTANGGPAAPTLADVPGEEILARLKNLANEMHAAQSRLDHATALKDALSTFAAEIKKIAPMADRAARLKNMGKALDHHADRIEEHAAAVAPSSEALRGEIRAITSELRTIAARAQANGAKEGPVLREAAMDLGARAESLFGYFEQQPALAPGAEDFDDESPADTTAADLAALAELIGRLETRAEHLSQTALAARFGEISDNASPAEREAARRAAETKTDGAIHTVFESIERLNNIAAALARAGDADRQRHAAH